MATELNPVMDYNEHNKTYGMFTKMVKYGVLLGVGVLIFMAITLL